MNDQPQCPFCQTPFDSVDLLTLHLIFDRCSPRPGEDHPAEASQPPAGHRPSRPELVPES